MASQTSIAIARAKQIKRINDALVVLAGKGHEIAPIPTQGRDAQILANAQFQHIADTLEAITQAPEFEVVDALDGDRDEAEADTEPVEKAAPTKAAKPTAKGKG